MSAIERIEVFRFRFSLEKPFIIALESISEVEEIIVRVVDDAGHEGWGEGSPSRRILSSTADTIICALDVLSPLLLGDNPCRLGYVVDRMDQALEGNSPAKAALDIALHDLVGRIYGEPVWRLLGGCRAEPVETDFTVGIDTPEAMAIEARGLIRKGFRTIKVKVGENPARDVERIRRIREAVGDGVTLRIDANQGWTRVEAVWSLSRMAELDIEFVEQPVPAWDIEGLAWVRQHSPIAVMADESAHSPQDAWRISHAGAADYINIKLMKAGGLRRASEIATICRAAGIPNMIGGMIESNLSATAAVHFAMAESNVIFRDLDMGARPEAQLITEGGSHIEVNHQVLSNPDAPGLGIVTLQKEWLGKPVRVYER
ncbi:MAG: L-Ala-D/L-Glu epimerase [Dehalococcoidia bacterium]|nr:L-Ala-D/L-Glu epimerase [Chloroflexota bacterium]